MGVNKNALRKYEKDILLIVNDIQEIEDYCDIDDLSFEDKIIYRRLLRMKDTMTEYLEKLNYFDGIVHEGILKMNSSGKFYFEYLDSRGYKKTCTYSCGSKMEVYLYDKYEEKYKWFLGIVEAGEEMNRYGYKYCFMGHTDKPYLQEGTKVRCRRSE